MRERASASVNWNCLQACTVVISYKISPGGRQLIVVAAGGHDVLGSAKGDYVVAWALPQSDQGG